MFPVVQRSETRGTRIPEILARKERGKTCGTLLHRKTFFHWPKPTPDDYTQNVANDNTGYMRLRPCWCQTCLEGNALECQRTQMAGDVCGPHHYWKAPLRDGLRSARKSRMNELDKELANFWPNYYAKKPKRYQSSGPKDVIDF